MRLVLLASVVALLAGSAHALAQAGGLGNPSPYAGIQSAPLPPRPVPVADPPPPGPLPAPRPMPVPPPPPGPPPEVPAWVDPGLDGFATRFWVNAEYLLWWIKDSTLPPLLTTGPARGSEGILGRPGTQVLIGGDVDNDLRSGARFSGGYWLTADRTIGLDGSFFFLGGDRIFLGDASHGTPVLARPFYDVATHRENASLVASPDRQSGMFTASLSSFLWGADANVRGLLARGPSYQISAIGGFRFLDLDESLRMLERDTIFPTGQGDVPYWTTSRDRFHTSNQFYGGQLGADVMWTRGRFFVDVLGKVALGVSVEEAHIGGWSSYSTSDGQGGSFAAGQMALPTNIGRYGKDQFAVVPEAGINFGYAVTRHLRLTIGYSFLYWSSVFRPGDQVDRGVNPSQVAALLGGGSMTGPARPNFTFKDTDFWAQGLNFGLQFRY